MDSIKCVIQNIAVETLEVARKNLLDGKSVRMTKNIQSDTKTLIKGMVEGKFNFFYNTSVTINATAQGELSVSTSCSCSERKQTLLCTHCAMLLLHASGAELSVSQNAEQIISPAAPAFVAAENTKSDSPLDISVPTDEIENEPPEEFIPRSMEIFLGENRESGEDVFWCPNDTSTILNPNTGIIGTMGTGKTQLTKSLVTQLYRKSADNYDGTPVGILIFDYKGDYNESHPDFVNATQAKIYKPYNFPLNPFALTIGKANVPALPLHVASAFTATIGKIYHLGDVQKQTLLDCIRDAYLAQGIRPDKPLTWTRKAPTFGKVFEQYDEKVRKKGDSLGSAMKRLNDFQIFESDPLKTRSIAELLQGVVVMDLSQYDSDIQNLIVAITLDLFYSYMKTLPSGATDGQYRQIRKIILVDEADNFMSEDFPSLRKILKEGREFGVGTILSTQFLNHFITGDDDYSGYIFTWIVHRVANLKSANVEYIFGTNAKMQDHKELCDEVKHLLKHQSVVKLGPEILKIQDYPFWKLLDEK